MRSDRGRVQKSRRARGPSRRHQPSEASPSAAELPTREGRLWAVAAAIAVAAFAVYLPTLGNGFTNWDDPGYVLKNSNLAPLDGRFLTWSFTTFRQANWHPLTWLSLGIDHALFGLAPWGYHLSNALFHSVTAGLVVLLVESLFATALGGSDGRSLAAAAVAGLVFAIHPLHVESVAWVSERKDVLCGFFYVLALLLYCRFIEHKRRTLYVSSLAAFALALLSKPMAVSLPAVLLILDVYPLHRLTRKTCVRVLTEKIPFALLSAAFSVLTLIVQWRGGAIAPVGNLGVGVRIWGAERALAFYLAKTVWPTKLAPIYPLDPAASPWRADFVAALVVVVGLTTAAVMLRRRVPMMAALWSAFVVMLLPTLGLVQVGSQAAADRYMYLPILAPAMAVAAVAVHVWQLQRWRLGAMTAGALATIALASSTVRQTSIWHDSATLWTWATEKQPGAAIAHYNLGEYLRSQGDLDGAVRCWQTAAAMAPWFSWPLNQLGNVAVLRGAIDDARAYYERATLVNETDPEAQYNLASFLEDQGQTAEARRHYEIFLRVAPPTFAYLFPEVRAKLALPPSP